MVGAGGHARVCVEAVVDAGHVIVGVVSRDGTAVEGLTAGGERLEVLGTDDELAAVVRRSGAEAVFVAVGDNEARAAATARALTCGVPVVAAVSRFAMVSSSAHVGAGAVVLAGAAVNAAASIGEGAIVNTRASVDHDAVIGAFAHVGPGAVLAGDVSIGVQAFVGAGAVVLPGRRVGDGAVVGAGAVVTEDVAPGATVVGVPARVVRNEGGDSGVVRP